MCRKQHYLQETKEEITGSNRSGSCIHISCVSGDLHSVHEYYTSGLYSGTSPNRLQVASTPTTTRQCIQSTTEEWLFVHLGFIVRRSFCLPIREAHKPARGFSCNWNSQFSDHSVFALVKPKNRLFDPSWRFYALVQKAGFPTATSSLRVRYPHRSYSMASFLTQ